MDFLNFEDRGLTFLNVVFKKNLAKTALLLIVKTFEKFRHNLKKKYHKNMIKLLFLNIQRDCQCKNVLTPATHIVIFFFKSSSSRNFTVILKLCSILYM